MVTGGRTGLDKVEVDETTWRRWTAGTPWELNNEESLVLGGEQAVDLGLVLHAVAAEAVDEKERALANKVLRVIYLGRGIVIEKK